MTGGLSITTKALVDTGAPRTVFPRGVADALAIDVPDEGEVRIELLGRSWPAVTVPVTLRLKPFDDPWDAGVDFVLDEGLPFGLLGYEGFLNRWAVSFNAYEGYFVVEPVEDFHQRLPADPLRALLERGPDPY